MVNVNSSASKQLDCLLPSVEHMSKLKTTILVPRKLAPGVHPSVGAPLPAPRVFFLQTSATVWGVPLQPCFVGLIQAKVSAWGLHQL
jgi:hypothetical protein